jgi:hypothetical protein
MANTAATIVLLLGTQNADGTITGVTTGTSQPIDVRGYPLVSVVLESVGTTSGGTVSIEQALWDPSKGNQPYTGTWSVIQSVAASTFTGTAQLFVNVSAIANGWIRIRISSTITGGGTFIGHMSACGNS